MASFLSALHYVFCPQLPADATARIISRKTLGLPMTSAAEPLLLQAVIVRLVPFMPPAATIQGTPAILSSWLPTLRLLQLPGRQLLWSELLWTADLLASPSTPVVPVVLPHICAGEVFPSFPNLSVFCYVHSASRQLPMHQPISGR